MVRVAVVTGAVVVVLGLGAVGIGGLGAGSGAVGARGREVAGTRAGVGAVAEELVGGVPAPGDPGPAVDVSDATPTATYAVPLDVPWVVARPFEAPAQAWAAGHRGADLAAHPGQVVRAPQSGVVTFVGTVVDRGVLTVTHADGLRSSLEPVQWSVRAGQWVARGQVVGAVAAVPGHCAPATCLHWGLRRGATYLDPMRWVLDRGPVVLLPAE